MVGAGITLCLDILHRSEAEPEFADHTKLVDQAVVLLGRYDGSALATRGMRLLSSLLEGTTKQQPLKTHVRYDKENMAWPLEDRQSIDAMWIDRQSATADERSQTTASTAPSSQQGCQFRNTPLRTVTENPDALDAPIQDAEDVNYMNPDGSFGAANDNGPLPDMTWSTDLIQDYFPAQSGFENPFLMEDLLTQAP